MKENTTFKTPYRIDFFLVDVFGKQFGILSIPYEKGDALKGNLKFAKDMVLVCRETASNILRKHYGFQGMKFGIKVKMLYR